jgi:hypothetical protein
MIKKLDKKKEKSIFKTFFLSFISFIVFSIGFFPLVFYGFLILKIFPIDAIWFLIFLPFISYLGFLILIVSQLLISGLIINTFKIFYRPGTYPYHMDNKTSYRWMILCMLYTPCRKIIETFIGGSLKNKYYRLLGMKIGKNTLVGGVIKDPCVTEFGNNTTMGEYSIVYGHIHNYEKGTISIDKVRIGNNCIIGAGAIVMPGAIIEDNVTLAAGALVTKKQILKKGKIYGGIPAKEIVK